MVHQWKRVMQRMATSGNEWYKEWQRVVQQVTMNDNCGSEWQRITTGDNSHNKWQQMTASGKKNENQWEQIK